MRRDNKTRRTAKSGEGDGRRKRGREQEKEMVEEIET